MLIALDRTNSNLSSVIESLDDESKETGDMLNQRWRIFQRSSLHRELSEIESMKEQLQEIMQKLSTEIQFLKNFNLSTK